MGGARRAASACVVASVMIITSLATGSAAVASAPPLPGAAGVAGVSPDATTLAGPGGSGTAGTTHAPDLDLDDQPPGRLPPGGPSDTTLHRASRSRAGDTAVVEVHHDGDRTGTEAAIVAAGGRVHGPAGRHAVEATVPLGAVAGLEATPPVTFVTTPTRAVPTFEDLVAGDPATGDPLRAAPTHARLTDADVWHSAGIRGQGVKVGIIDVFDSTAWSRAVAAGDLKGPPAGTFCRWAGWTCDVWSARSAHGVAVAEVVHEMAPDAQLYLADATTTADFQAAIDYFHGQGVQIVTRSQTAEYDGPGDGTGGLADVIDDAISKGMLYLNSAGNSGGSEARVGSYWRGPWVDADNDGWMEFAPGVEVLSTICWYFNGLRWDDWGLNPTDYDVVVYDLSVTPRVPIGASTNDQRAGAPPIERFNHVPCRLRQPVGIAIYRHHAGNGTAGDTLEVMVNGAGLDHWSNPHAAAAPMADLTTPGALAVGAIDPASGPTIAPYSSHGPTNSGHLKPDLVAPSCVATTAYAPSCFNGTSASAPAAAGAAALALSAGVATTPAALAAYLRGAAQDRGAHGPDPVYGHGTLHLPVGDPTPFATTAALIDRQFRDFVGRPPTPAERTAWIHRFLVGSHTRADLVAFLRGSNDNRAHVDPVVRLYRAALSRPPDPAGLRYWSARARSGTALARISAWFAASSEFTARDGALGDAAFVDRLYRDVLARSGDPAGRQYWQRELRSGRRTRGMVLVGFSESAEFRARQAKAVNVSVVIISMLRRPPGAWEMTTLVGGPANASLLAEYAFTRPDYSVT